MVQWAVGSRQSFLSLSGGVRWRVVTRRRPTSSLFARPGSRVFCSRIFLLVPSEWYLELRLVHLVNGTITGIILRTGITLELAFFAIGVLKSL